MGLVEQVPLLFLLHLLCHWGSNRILKIFPFPSLPGPHSILPTRLAEATEDSSGFVKPLILHATSVAAVCLLSTPYKGWRIPWPSAFLEWLVGLNSQP